LIAIPNDFDMTRLLKEPIDPKGYDGKNEKIDENADHWFPR
jgi:hypothetical protein